MTPIQSEPFLTSDQERRASKDHLDLGRLGEDLACRLLWRRGFRVLERNFRAEHCEIDIVAEKSGRVRFVEVKTRSSATLGPPEERVDSRKRESLRKAAKSYLARFREAPPGGVQFDVMAQVIDPVKRCPVEQTLIENAM